MFGSLKDKWWIIKCEIYLLILLVDILIGKLELIGFICVFIVLKFVFLK